MQRKYQFLWLALVPLGAAGALATGMVSLPWQPSADDNKIANAAKPAAPKTQSSSASPKGGKLAALEKQTKQAKLPLTKVPGDSASPTLSSKKSKKFGIDVARINPDGSSVIAGYSEPGKPVTIMANGKPIGVVTPDQSGDWVLVTPHKFSSLDPKISLKAGDHTVKTVAALATKSASPAKGVPQPVASSTTAAQVTERMLQRLKKLTKEASSNAAEATKTAPEPASKAPSKQVPASVSVAAAPSAPSTKPSPVQSAPVEQASVKPAPAKAIPDKPASKPVVKTERMPKQELKAPASKQQLALAVTPSRLGGPQALKSAPRQGSEPVVQKAAVSESIPVPVQFVYREAVFTDKGREAAVLLLKYFKAKQFNSVVLSGHADERGTPAANKKLSRQRLATIRKFLRDGGFYGRMKLIPMGETQKFTGVDRSKFSIEELYQLDRRVEVMSAR